MKSKMNIRNIIVLAIISIISLFFINISFAANTAKVSVETAKLREEPNLECKVLELISVDEQVEVLEKTGDWYKVKYKNIVGYLRQDLITVDGETQEVSAETTQEEPIKEPEENQEEQPVQNNEIKKDLLGKQKIAQDTKLKIVPSINATEIIEVKADSEVTVTEMINGWLCVETETTKGWIRQEKIKSEEQQTQVSENTENPSEETQQEEQEQQEAPEVQQETVIKTLFVNSTSINLRKEPNTSSEVLATLPVNTAVDVISEANGWSKVKVSGKEGYILSTLLSSKKQETSRSSEAPRTSTNDATANTTASNISTSKEANAQTTTSNTSSVSTIGANVVETARKYLGCKYVYGGSTPSGFDCSGFTSYVFKAHGVSLNRTAAGQYSNGVAVSKSSLQAGDLVMFGKSGINHVGIYIGGGMMIHAANPSRGVTTDTINSGYYYNNYVGARRVN